MKENGFKPSFYWEVVQKKIFCREQILNVMAQFTLQLKMVHWERKDL